MKKISKLKNSSREEIYITFFSFCEYYYGIINRSKKNKSKALDRLNQYKILNSSKQTGIIFCEVLNYLKNIGTLISKFDLFIASFALEYNFTLITIDSHFKKIPELKLEIVAL